MDDVCIASPSIFKISISFFFFKEREGGGGWTGKKNPSFPQKTLK